MSSVTPEIRNFDSYRAICFTAGSKKLLTYEDINPSLESRIEGAEVIALILTEKTDSYIRMVFDNLDFKKVKITIASCEKLFNSAAQSLGIESSDAKDLKEFYHSVEGNNNNKKLALYCQNLVQRCLSKKVEEVQTQPPVSAKKSNESQRQPLKVQKRPRTERFMTNLKTGKLVFVEGSLVSFKSNELKDTESLRQEVLLRNFEKKLSAEDAKPVAHQSDEYKKVLMKSEEAKATVEARVTREDMGPEQLAGDLGLPLDYFNVSEYSLSEIFGL